MSESDAEEPEQQGFQFFVPPEEEPGTYANTFAIWSTAYDFVFDFGMIQLAQLSDPTDPASPFVTPARVVSRIVMPRNLIFEFIKTITSVMDVHEKHWGPIKHPELLDLLNEEGDEE